MADVKIPSQFRLRVRTRKGNGTVEKVRDDSETASFLVRLDTGGNPFWAKNENLEVTGFARVHR